MLVSVSADSTLLEVSDFGLDMTPVVFVSSLAFFFGILLLGLYLMLVGRTIGGNLAIDLLLQCRDLLLSLTLLFLITSLSLSGLPFLFGFWFSVVWSNCCVGLFFISSELMSLGIGESGCLIVGLSVGGVPFCFLIGVLLSLVESVVTSLGARGASLFSMTVHVLSSMDAAIILLVCVVSEYFGCFLHNLALFFMWPVCLQVVHRMILVVLGLVLLWSTFGSRSPFGVGVPLYFGCFGHFFALFL